MFVAPVAPARAEPATPAPTRRSRRRSTGTPHPSNQTLELFEVLRQELAEAEAEASVQDVPAPEPEPSAEPEPVEQPEPEALDELPESLAGDVPPPRAGPSPRPATSARCSPSGDPTHQRRPPRPLPPTTDPTTGSSPPRRAYLGAMPDFQFQEMFPQSAGDTPFRKLTDDLVVDRRVPGPPGAGGGSRGADAADRRGGAHDISHLFRPGHLAQLRKILDDPEATENDRFVARTMLQNAYVVGRHGAADLPGHRHRDRHGQEGPAGLDPRGRPATASPVATRPPSPGASTAPTPRPTSATPSWRRSRCTRRCNTGTNLPAQIDLTAVDGDEYKFLFMTKGGGSANKTFLFQETKALLNPESLLALRRREDQDARHVGLPAVPPGDRRSAARRPR